jgi:oligopeptide/dipeptide ABC transporter ATP-binding protein
MTVARTPLIEIRDLCTDYVTSGGWLGRRRVRVLDHINLEIRRGETLGVVGESGCGKTTLGRSVLRLITPTSGQVLFEGTDILRLGKAGLRSLRREMQMVFQNPFSSLNPRMNILDLVAEPLRTHTNLRGKALEARVEELLAEVGLSAGHLKRHPHQLSGGQAQRVALARALALNPRFLVLDEPTSALDVSVQAQIVNLLGQLQRDHGLTYLFISHDLSVVQHISDRIAVMYLGQIVELASGEAIFRDPQHPYTQALLASTPLPDPDSGRTRIILEGTVPSPAYPPAGCRFHTRCPHVMDICRTVAPQVHAVSDGRWARCHLLANDHRER